MFIECNVYGTSGVKTIKVKLIFSNAKIIPSMMNLTRINSVQSTLFGISHVRFNGRYMKSKRKYSFDLDCVET